ncbi:hypothetical protein DQ04_01351200 [Trypanosoma grayi]|uniref:hypothetical protein n=1 Tax=Trypanosoma grayi TaxID=71804 RepID=UPI0004F469A9|nr:hypothetical protein DQ04_01351200 [Trypanosoma grayi]KEG12897.1 hypothetical protein DQ04_01351200 [Trypanosoma grayi]
MSEHILYAKPLVVTEEKLREAREKQQKQRALREALDTQIEQSKKRKQGGASQKKNGSGAANDGVGQRYTFSYENGYGKFVQRDEDTDIIENPTTTSIKRAGQNKPASPTAQQRPLYQSNSLPPNFAMSTSESNPLAPKRPEYNTKSLPVDLVSNKAKINGACNIVSPRIRELLPRGRSSQRSPPPMDASGEAEYQTNCLPRNFNLEDVKKQFQQQQQQQRLPLSPQRTGVPAGGLRSPFSISPRTPKRPGGPLPPLEHLEGANGRRASGRVSPTFEVDGSPTLEHLVAQGQGPGTPRPLKPKQPPALRRKSNETRARPTPGAVAPRSVQTRVTENKVERLQKELESRDFAMAKMREKERNWEEQVKQLKLELKNARKKERDLNKLVKEGPRRAETAPDQPVESTPVLGSPGTGGKKGVRSPSALHLGKKQNFAKSRIFTQEAFRAISAPSEVASTSYVPLSPSPLPPLQESFKCASVLTRKTAFGLPLEHANRPVSIEYEHLLQFVKEQIITQQQADGLWRLFTNEVSPLSLLRRQSGGARVVGGPVVVDNSTFLPREKSPPELEHDIAVQDDEIEKEQSDELETGFDNGKAHYGEGISDEPDTFETFAELHLEEYLSQEESDAE